MNTIKKIIFPQDINKIPNTVLKVICDDMEISSTGTSGELTNRIWEVYDRIPEGIFKRIEENAMAGSTSIAWFQLNKKEETLLGTKDKIIEELNFDPFNEVRIPNEDEILSEPKVICGATIGNDREYYLRFIHRTGTTTSYFVNTQHVGIRQEITTVYVDEGKGIIEVRANATNAKKVASSFASLINRQIAFEQIDVIAPYGREVEKLADALNGTLYDTVGKPESLDTEFKEEDGEFIVNVLAALDKYFSERNINELVTKLDNEELNEVLSSTPFTNLLLSGLETVGLGSIRDLRGQPLYDYIEPYIQKQRGSILFNVVEDGLVQEYSVKIGVRSKTLKFNTPATEKAIRFVRERIALI